MPDTTLDKVSKDSFDMIVLPGGLPGADHLNRDSRIHEILHRLSVEGKYTAAICAAPKILAKAGILNGKNATSYPGVLEAIGANNIKIVQESVVIDGKVVTSRGPGTAMDFALELIEILVGKNKRDEVEKSLVR